MNPRKLYSMRMVAMTFSRADTHVPHLYVMICACKELKLILYIPFIFMHYDFLFMFTVPKVKPRLSINIV